MPTSHEVSTCCVLIACKMELVSSIQPSVTKILRFPMSEKAGAVGR